MLVVRVNELVPRAVWESRYDQINAFEAHLAANGTRIVKLFLHISRDEQRARFQKRLDNPAKHWKWKSSDLETREKWDAYQAAYADALARCSTPSAPWYVIPADHKWYRDLAAAEILAETAREMDPKWPEPEEDLAAVVIPSETDGVPMRMKHRWIGGLALAVAVTLAACAPPSQGGAESDGPSAPAEGSTPAMDRADGERECRADARRLRVLAAEPQPGALKAAPGEGEQRLDRPLAGLAVGDELDLGILGNEAPDRQDLFASPGRAGHQSGGAGPGPDPAVTCPRRIQSPSGSPPAGVYW